MTNHECITLQHSGDKEFVGIAGTLGLVAVGPSLRGSFLLHDRDGRAWLFGEKRARGTMGRTVVESVWTELNLAVMNRQLAGGGQ